MNKRTFKAEDAVIIYIIGFLVYQAIGVALMTLLDTETNTYLYLAYLAPQVSYIGATAVYVLVAKTEYRLLPTRESVKPIHYLIAVIIGIGLFFFGLLPNFGLQRLFALLGKNPTVSVPQFNGVGDYILAFLVLCVLPAIGEEIIFRKNLCDGFGRYGAVLAILLSGVIFGLSHFNLAQTVYQVILGCVLSYLYIKTGNITLTSIIHLINNSLALFLTCITGEEIWNNIVTLGISFAIGAALVISGLFFLYKTAPKLRKEKGEKPSKAVIGFIIVFAALWLVTAIVV